MKRENSSGGMGRALALVALLLVTGLAGGCKSSTAPDSPGGGTGTGSMSLKHNGEVWVSEPVPGGTGALVTHPGHYTITGYRLRGSAATTVQMTLYNVRGTGTYALGVTAPLSGGIAAFSGVDAGWLTPLSGSAGWVTISTLTADRIAGTFAFVADQLVLGAGEPCVVTDGVFDYPIDTEGIGPMSDRDGGWIRAKLDGAHWNAASALALPVSTAGDTVLIVSAGNTRARLVINTIVRGPGTYPLAYPGTSLQVTDEETGKAWGGWATPGPGPAGSGEVIFTGVTATRVQGRFSARLAPNPADGGPDLIVTDGEFDLGLPEAASGVGEGAMSSALAPASRPVLHARVRAPN